MNAKEPILVIAPSNTARWLARLFWLFPLLLGASAIPAMIRESSIEIWMQILFGTGLALFLFMTIRAWRLTSWEIRLTEDSIVRLNNGQESEFTYERILRFDLNRSFGSKTGPAALTIWFDGDRYVKIPVGHEFDVMAIVQGRVDHEIPGYEKEHLTLTGK